MTEVGSQEEEMTVLVSITGVKDTSPTLYQGVDFQLLEAGAILMPGKK